MSGLTLEEFRIFSGALEHYGSDAQQKMLLEEMSELQKEICKAWRGKDNLEHIAEEMADVRIMLDQMTLLYQNGGLQQKYRMEKVERLAGRLMNDGVIL